MGFIKESLFRITGQKLYLKLVSKVFLTLFRMGILKLFPKFQDHYLAQKITRSGDYIIDIGANLGYFTTIFSRKSGKDGRVFAVEPVDIYRSVLESNTRKLNNIEIIPYALGETDEVLRMGIPSNLRTRHGLTRIIDGEEQEYIDPIFTVEVKRPEIVFKDIKKLDYIKCDIEGYEDKVIPGFKDLIGKFRPIIQIELADESYNFLVGILNSFGYSAFFIKENRLSPATVEEEPAGDLFFLTKEHKGINNRLFSD